MFFIILFSFIVSIRAIDKRLEDREKKQPKKEKRDWLGYSVLIVAALFMLVYSIPYTMNLFNKLVPINQTIVEGEVIDEEYHRNKTPKADNSTYELTVLFQAKDG